MKFIFKDKKMDKEEEFENIYDTKTLLKLEIIPGFHSAQFYFVYDQIVELNTFAWTRLLTCKQKKRNFAEIRQNRENGYMQQKKVKEAVNLLPSV